MVLEDGCRLVLITRGGLDEIVRICRAKGWALASASEVGRVG